MRLDVRADAPVSADRLAALVEERRSQVCLGLDPDPAKLTGDGPVAVRRRRHARRARRPRRRRPLPRADRARRAGLRRGQAAARLLRAPRRARLGGARRGLRGRPRGRACWSSPTASAATCRSPPPPTPRRWSARRRPRGARSPGLGADAFTANPLLGARRARAAGRGRRGGRGRRLRPGPHQQPRRRRPAGPARPGARRCTSASPRSSTALSDRLLGERRPERDGRGGRRHRARAHRPPARADAALDLPASPASAPRAAGRSCSAPPSRPGPAAALVAASRSIAADPDPAAAAERLRAAVWDVSDRLRDGR